jgi:hypothetical protein
MSRCLISSSTVKPIDKFYLGRKTNPDSRQFKGLDTSASRCFYRPLLNSGIREDCASKAYVPLSKFRCRNLIFSGNRVSLLSSLRKRAKDKIKRNQAIRCGCMSHPDQLLSNEKKDGNIVGFLFSTILPLWLWITSSWGCSVYSIWL